MIIYANVTIPLILMIIATMHDSPGNTSKLVGYTLREKCPYSEFFWSVFSPNAGNKGPEKLRIQTLFTQ